MFLTAIFTSPSADILVVLVLVLLFFGPKRLPGLGKSLGSGIREFKDGISRGSDSAEEEKKAEVGSGSASGPGDSGSAG